MSTLITTTASWDDVRAPENTEEGDAGDLIATTIRPLGNRTHFLGARCDTLDGLASRLALSGGKTIPIRNRAVLQAAYWAAIFGTDAEFYRYWVQQNDVTPGTGVVVEITEFLVHGNRIASFGATVNPGTGHSELPMQRPRVLLCRESRLVDSGSWTTVATATDSPTTIAGFEAIHTFAATGVNHPIDLSYRYYLDFHGEIGTYALTGLRLLDFTLGCTT